MVRRVSKESTTRVKWWRHRSKTQAAEIIAKWLSNPFTVEVVVEAPRVENGKRVLKRKTFMPEHDINVARRVIERPEVDESTFGIGWCREHRVRHCPLAVEAKTQEFEMMIARLKVLKLRIAKATDESKRRALIDEHDELVHKMWSRKGRIPDAVRGVVRPYGMRPDGAE